MGCFYSYLELIRYHVADEGKISFGTMPKLSEIDINKKQNILVFDGQILFQTGLFITKHVKHNTSIG